MNQIPTPPPPKDLLRSVAYLDTYCPGDPTAKFLRDLAAQIQRIEIRIVPDEHQDHVWIIDGVPAAVPGRSMVFWQFFMALRDGSADLRWNYDTPTAPASVRNARQRIVRWLERIGHRALAGEVLKCRIHDDGLVAYVPTGNSPRLIFD